MKTQTLQIRFTETVHHAPCAWFIGGSSAAGWLEEIVSWNVPHSAIRLFVVPDGHREQKPVGVLVIVDGTAPEHVSPRCQRYTTLAERLSLPVEAKLSPAVDESELRELLSDEMQFVWHPTAGFVGFEPGDVLGIADLLKPFSTESGKWACADPGVTFGRRLVSVEALRPLSVEAILQSGQDDIGTRHDDIESLPPAPDESPPPGPVKSSLSTPLRAVAKFVNWVAGKAPEGASGKTWVDRAQDWARNVLSSDWKSARERELSRLMHMLKENPDDGLKYALPMNSEPGRGVAPPSAQLGYRDVDFRLSAGGGPVDYWEIPPDAMLRLMAQYRDLASREIRLGRFRRAAYIYAELLGDMESAAAALKSGGYFREAAVVYEEKLQRPRIAAECLEEAGLWNEAIALYEKLEEYEKCGELYRRLEQHEQAEAAYGKAAERLLAQGNYLSAARLYETELHDSDRALNALESGWPNSTQAKNCLQEQFHLLGRTGQHQFASRRVADLVETLGTMARTVELVEVLSDAAGDYPDEAVRDLCADSSRVVVSRKLVSAHKDSAAVNRRLLTAIEKLAPEDRLLQRDCDRYLREDRKVQTVPRRRSGKLERVSTTSLPDGIRWECAASTREYCCAAGFRDYELVIVRGAWKNLDRTFQSVSWKSSTISRFSNSSVLLAPSPNDSHHIWVQLAGLPALPTRMFAADDSSSSATKVVTPPWTSRETIALAQTPNGVTWMLSNGADAVLSVFSASDVPILTRQLPMPNLFPPTDEVPAPSMHVRSEGAYIGMGRRLVSIDARDRYNLLEMSGAILSISGSAPHSRVRVAAGFERGGAVYWEDSSEVRPFGADLFSPQLAFTVSGNLVAVDHQAIEVYRTDNTRLTLQAESSSPGEPVSVMPVGSAEFAILDSKGTIHIYRTRD